MIFFILYSKDFVEFLQTIDKHQFFDQTIYLDLNREWFNDVGTKILLTIFVSLVNPSLIYVFQMWVFRCLGNIRAAGAKTMREYILNKTPPHFDIEKRFALILNIFLISIALSGGIPIMILVISLSMFLLFYSEKYVFTSYIKKPPMYTGVISSMITKFLPFASLLSIGVTIYVLGNQELYPVQESNSTFDDFINSLAAESNSTYFNIILQRMKTCWPLTILFAVVLVYLILQDFFFRCLEPCIFRKKEHQKENLFYKDTKEIWKYNDKVDYDFRRNEKYFIIQRAWQN